ncbi:GIY-YIG nuclease family protein [Hyphobacterium sp.]|uniref:GIY-YIG nuclease family protein n=1 Tax=Hyphobacterium sp. TaxID=2004662 RepID=UPI003BAD7373
MSSRQNGPIYTGVTADLIRRVYEHRGRLSSGFVQKYNCRRLVWYEPHEMMAESIYREKRLKRWLRAWKVAMIEAANPDWRDLSETLWPD